MSKFRGGTQWILHFMKTFKEVIINTRLDIVRIFLKNLQKKGHICPQMCYIFSGNSSLEQYGEVE